MFAARGFHAASVPEIAAAAGVSVGLMYRYFKGKSELAVAIVERARDQTIAGIESVAAENPDPQRALELLIAGWIEIAVADRRGCALVAEIGAEATRDGAIAAAAAAYDAAVIGAVTVLVARAPSPVDPVAVATLTVSALDGLVGRIAADEDFDPLASAGVLRAALRLLLGGGSPA